VSAHATLGAGRVDLKGPLSVRQPFRADLTVGVTDADLHELAGIGLTTRLGLRGRVGVQARGDGTLGGDFTVQEVTGKLADQPMPSTILDGDFEQARDGGGWIVAVRGRASGSGARVLGRAELSTAPTSTMTFAIEGQLARLDLVPSLGAHVTGAAELRVEGGIRLDRAPTVSARLDVRATHVRARGASAAHARLTGEAWGSVVDPELRARGDAVDVTLGPYRFRQGRLETHGPLRRQRVEIDLGGRDPVRARGHVTLVSGAAFGIEDAALTFWRGPWRVDAGVDRTCFELGAVDVESLGEPMGGLSKALERRSTGASWGAGRFEPPSATWAARSPTPCGSTATDPQCEIAGAAPLSHAAWRAGSQPRGPRCGFCGRAAGTHGASSAAARRELARQPGDGFAETASKERRCTSNPDCESRTTFS
jgi:hypothetical protein